MARSVGVDQVSGHFQSGSGTRRWQCTYVSLDPLRLFSHVGDRQASRQAEQTEDFRVRYKAQTFVAPILQASVVHGSSLDWLFAAHSRAADAAVAPPQA